MSDNSAGCVTLAVLALGLWYCSSDRSSTADHDGYPSADEAAELGVDMSDPDGVSDALEMSESDQASDGDISDYAGEEKGGETYPEYDERRDALDGSRGSHRGYGCTVDCGGHEAGYDWAEREGVTDADDCAGKSWSFEEGCRSYAEERQ